MKDVPNKFRVVDYVADTEQRNICADIKLVLTKPRKMEYAEGMVQRLRLANIKDVITK